MSRRRRKTSADKPTHVVDHLHEDQKGLIVFGSHGDFSFAVFYREDCADNTYVRSGVFSPRAPTFMLTKILCYYMC